MTCPTGGAPNINYGKNTYGKNRSICPSPLISQEKSIMEIMATSKNYGKKKGSDHFRDILNPYGEKSNYGKIGRRRRLSKLNVLFFSIILSVTIYIYTLYYIHILFIYHHISLYIYISLSIYLSIHPSISLSVCLYLSTYLPIYLSIYLYNIYI